MEENLENFVNLLNRYRQPRPVPKELSRLPGWAQRKLSNRPEAPPPQGATHRNGTPQEDRPRPEIIHAAKPAQTRLPEGAPPQAGVGPSPDQPKGEPPVDKIETPASAADPIDPKSDPEAWLARILSDEGDKLVHGATGTAAAEAGTRASEQEIPGDDEIEPAPAIAEAGTKESETELPGEDDPGPAPTIEPPKTVRRPSEATELVPLQPVIVTRMGSARRTGMAYAMPMVAAVAVIALGVGGYWLLASRPKLVADIKAEAKLLAVTPAAKSPPATVAALPVGQAKSQPTEKKPVPAPVHPVAPRLAAAPNAQIKMAQALPARSISSALAASPPKSQAKPVHPPAKITGTQSTAAVFPPATRPAAAPPPEPMTSHPIVAAEPVPPAVAPVRPASTVRAQDSSALAMLLTNPAPTTNRGTASHTPPKPQSTVVKGGKPAWLRNAVPAPPFEGRPQVAIVIDDLGLDRNRTERAIALRGPVTLSFLAYASDLPQQTEAARHAGHELVVHVPMEPILRSKLVTRASSGAEPAHAELLRRLRWDLSRFSGYVGVDNPSGNRLSTNREATEAVIDELKNRGLVFLDSRSGGAGSLSDAARKGVPTVTRDVLLDDDVTVSSVNDRLSQLEAIARQRGTAVAVGHPHDLTLGALKAWITSLPEKGLQLVPLTAIVRDREQHEARAD